jgi:hypothetical protein
MIANKGEILLEFQDQGEAPHKERAEMCNHDELAWDFRMHKELPTCQSHEKLTSYFNE